MFLSDWREFPLASCLAEKKKNLMTAPVSMLLKSHVSLKCFQARFLPGRAKDLSAPQTLLHGVQSPVKTSWGPTDTYCNVTIMASG